MSVFAPLLTTLLDLAYAVRAAKIPLMIGGGYGLHLKEEHLRQSGERTLLKQLPESRATNDIDLFLRVDVLASLTTMQQVAHALSFEVVENAKYFQWRRTLMIGDVEQEVKADLLVGPLDEHRGRLKTNKLPRVRPQGQAPTPRLLHRGGDRHRSGGNGDAGSRFPHRRHDDGAGIRA